MRFEVFNQKVQKRFEDIAKIGKLFRSTISGNELWELYIGSFNPGDDPVFRDPASTEHTCNNDKNFIRRYGNIVALDGDNNIVTMFDIDAVGTVYESPIKAITKALKGASIANIFVESFTELNILPYEKCKPTNRLFQLGIVETFKRYTKDEANKYGVVNDVDTWHFHHFHVFLPNQYVDNSSRSVEAIMGEFRSDKDVFLRAMETIPIDTYELVIDLINQGSLLNGTTYIKEVEEVLKLKKVFDSLPIGKRDNWTWIASYKNYLAKFRNKLIGVLCVELAEGMEINTACANWNKREDPQNKMKPTAPITSRQKEEAKKFVEENGYVESFDRRFATIDDIKVSEILHSNVGDGTLKNVSIFDGVKPTSTRHKRSEFDKVEEVSIEKFMDDILPGCTSIEAFLTSQHEGNLVSLTTANVKDSKPIFRWDNNYSWTFNGNLAGKSQLTEEVKSKGGNIDGVLRCSMSWGDDKNGDHSDLDLWCSQPDGVLIGFSTGYRKDSGKLFSSCGGQLDLDDRGGGDKIKVENIYFRTLREMKDGVYKFWVNQYSASGSKGVKLEIEFNGELYSYIYDKPIVYKSNLHVAEVTLSRGAFTIRHLLPVSEGIGATKEIYGLETNQFHRVNLVCLTPNHWGDNKVGHKHYLFMLDGCRSTEPIRSFHNENLITELAAHRKVLEVLGNTCTIASTPKQLSGLGFNSTVKDELILKLSGSHKRVVRIKF